MIRHDIRTITKYLGFVGPSLFNRPHLCLLSTSPVINLKQKWREERGLPQNPNACGVLTDSPDYSFLDGRPTPYGVKHMKRLLKQKEVAEQIIQLTGEIDFAVERHKKMQIEEEEGKKQILENKLKSKGLLLLKKK